MNGWDDGTKYTFEDVYLMPLDENKSGVESNAEPQPGADVNE
jgi:hypothetical protein